MLRTGVTPEGKMINLEFMPRPITERMTDDELAVVCVVSKVCPHWSDHDQQ